MEAKKPRLTRRVMISAMHELRSPTLTQAENQRIYGKCLNLHGHDYWLEATVEGSIDAESGLICDRDYFEDRLQEFFVNKFDKTNLGHFFKITTGEVLVKEFYHLLKTNLLPLKVIGVRLQETPKNFFTMGTSSYMEEVF